MQECYPNDRRPKSQKLWELLAQLKPKGNPNLQESMAEKVDALEKRFEKYQTKNGECIELKTSIRGNGYPSFSFANKNFRGNRFAWLFYKGDIPEGMVICHVCDNRLCVNINHLWLGTSKENNADTTSKGRHHETQKTHCAKGHPFDKTASPYSRQTNRRGCSICRNQKDRDYRKRLKNAHI